MQGLQARTEVAAASRNYAQHFLSSLRTPAPPPPLEFLNEPGRRSSRAAAPYLTGPLLSTLAAGGGADRPHERARGAKPSLWARGAKPSPWARGAVPWALAAKPRRAGARRFSLPNLSLPASQCRRAHFSTRLLSVCAGARPQSSGPAVPTIRRAEQCRVCLVCFACPAALDVLSAALPSVQTSWAVPGAAGSASAVTATATATARNIAKTISASTTSDAPSAFISVTTIAVASAW